MKLRVRWPWVGLLLLITVCIGLVAWTFANRKREAEETTRRVYDSIIASADVKIGPDLTTQAATDLKNIESKFGRVRKYEVQDIRAKLDLHWEVDVSVVRSRGSTTETVTNMGKNGQVARVFAKGRVAPTKP